MNRSTRERLDRYRGCLLGLAVGDALGTTLEFQVPGTFAPVGDMVGGGPFRLRPGEWTDDTSMALCLAESLLECDGFDAADQMRRYVRWYREGHLSSTGRCFDIGNTVRYALHRFERTGDPLCDARHPGAPANGSRSCAWRRCRWLSPARRRRPCASPRRARARRTRPAKRWMPAATPPQGGVAGRPLRARPRPVA